MKNKSELEFKPFLISFKLESCLYRRLENVKKDLPTAKGELNGVMEQLQTQRTDKAQSEQKVARLRAELQGMRTAAEKSKSANKLADALREECAAGRIPGVYGRLGDLGAIDAKYDYAITSASGSLDNILVDTVSITKIPQAVNLMLNISGRNWCQMLEIPQGQPTRQSVHSLFGAADKEFWPQDERAVQRP